jgi:hypothetical protein
VCLSCALSNWKTLDLPRGNSTWIFTATHAQQRHITNNITTTAPLV